MQKIFALLVGINDYLTVTPLQGCVHDAHAWQQYLEEWAGPEGRLELEVLTDRQATREAILSTFRSHLGQAGPGDTALFCFSGHGSEELAPSPWAEEEPGGLSETILAVDSRAGGVPDIADKELAVLIAEVARGGAHVAVFLDSCHSGTGTRDPGVEGRVRRVPVQRAVDGSVRRRQAGSYWFEGDASVPAELDEAGGWRVLPNGRHVVLAACDDWQVAIESPVGDVQRGLFTWCVLEALRHLGPGITYGELFKRARSRVRGLWSAQVPQAEGDLDVRVFDGAVTPRRASFHVRREEDEDWWLDAGAVHGIDPDTELALLPLGTPAGDLGASLGTVRVDRVEPGRSHVSGTPLDDPVARGTIFGAEVTRLPLPRVSVAIEAPEESAAPVREAIGRSPALQVAASPDRARLSARLREDGWWLHGSAGSAPRVEAPVASPGDVATLVRALEHVERWLTIAGLANPSSPVTGAIETTVYEWLGPGDVDGAPLVRPGDGAGAVRMRYRAEAGGSLRPPRIAIHLVNRSDEPLYYALLALDEGFAVGIPHGGTGRLAPGAEVWIGKSRGIRGEVPDALHRLGVTRRRDLLVLLVSAQEADFEPLRQGRVLGPLGLRDLAPDRSPGVLGSLIRRIGWRELADEAPSVADRWAVSHHDVVTVRPLPWVQLGAGESRSLVPGGPVPRVSAPVGWTDALRLQPRDELPGAAATQRLAVDRGWSIRSAVLAGELASDPGLSLLEVRGPSSASVTLEEPLVVETQLALAEDERLVAIGWIEGEAAVLGEGDRGDGTLSIGRLPSPHAGGDGTRWIELGVLTATS